jgi:hypothetical protein
LLSDTPSTLASSNFDVDDGRMDGGRGRDIRHFDDHNDTAAPVERDAIDVGNSSDEEGGIMTPSLRRRVFDHEEGYLEETERDIEGTHFETAWYSNPMQISAMLSNFSTSYVRANCVA